MKLLELKQHNQYGLEVWSIFLNGTIYQTFFSPQLAQTRLKQLLNKTGRK
jgi:hypothetical protein